MAIVTRSQLLSAIDRKDWTIKVFGVSVPLTITFDSFVSSVLLDDIIDLTPQLVSMLEHSFRDRPNTISNIRKLA